MAFQLRIAEGKEAGKELAFDQPSVLIGRTPECDIILYDPGVSRQHARITQEDAAFFVEDMGSANGTRVNGEAVKKVQLNEGDNISLGPVVFTFVPQEERTRIVQMPTVQEQHTRIVSVDDVSPRDREKDKTRIKLLPEGLDEDEAEERLARNTMAPSPRRSGGRSSGAAVRGSGSGSRASGGRMAAADRARLRRESGGVAGSLRIFWHEASPAVRGLIGAGVGLVAALIVGGAIYSLLNRSGGVVIPPPEVISDVPVEQSFGLGPDVTFNMPDKVVFKFAANSPSRTVAVLHYQSADIQNGEVAITINGAALGSVPPDTLAKLEQSHELFIPANLVKKAEKNTVMFDNLKNPPGEDPWRIWNIWIEVVPLPEMPLPQLKKDAQDSFDRGSVEFDRREIAAESGFKAWKAFRSAWLLLEAYPDPKPETYMLARDRMFEAQRQLDLMCQKLMLEAKRDLSQKDYDSARSTLDQVHQYFPTKEQPCPLLAESLRESEKL